MNVLPKIRIKYGENIGVEVFSQPPDLDGNNTFLNSDYSAGATSLAVDNGIKFTNGNYIIVGNRNTEKTEIILINGATNATTIPINASVFSHTRGEPIQFIPYNQIIIESSSNGVSYSVIAILGIRFDSTETYYNDTSGTNTTYYRARFKNSTTNLYSQYSDPVIGAGYLENSVGRLIRSVLVSSGNEIDEKMITKEFLYEALNEGRLEIDQHININRWSFRSSFDYNAGQIISGTNKVAVPTNLRDKNTNANILSVRIGKNLYPLHYIDKQALNNFYYKTPHSTLNGAITTGSTSIILADSGDFDESGSITIAGSAVNELADIVSYTSNNESTAVLGGVTSITANHSDGADVWQNQHFGMPQYYTVDNGYIIFERPFDDSLDGQNIWLDYYKDITNINSDGDLLDEPFYNIYIPWLKWKIKSKKDSSLAMSSDSDYLDWVAKREAQVAKNYTGQNIRISIDLPK